jgi:AcrR family transcriptional regulator
LNARSSKKADIRGGGRPRGAPGERREEILDSIVKVLLTSGLADFSVREIGNRIGLRAPTLLHHFGDREGLLLAVFARVVQYQRQTFERIAEQSGSLTSAIRALWGLHGRKSQQPALRAMMEVQGQWLARPDRYGPMASAWVRGWHAELVRLMTRDGLDAPKAEVLATIFASAYRGWLVDFLSTGDRERGEAAMDAMLGWYDAFARSTATRANARLARAARNRKAK